MFEIDNVSQNFATTQDLYCVWIRASEAPGSPLIAVWMDKKMRAFETTERQSSSIAPDCQVVKEAEAFDS